MNFSHLSALRLHIVSRTNKRFELLLYGFTLFQPKENQKVWNGDGKESDTIWNRENLPTFLLYGFMVTATYQTSFLPVFLSSQYINTDRTRLIRYLLIPILFVLHSFAWFFLFPFFIFCYYLCHAMVWMIVMLKFWLQGLLI